MHKYRKRLQYSKFDSNQSTIFLNFKQDKVNKKKKKIQTATERKH